MPKNENLAFDYVIIGAGSAGCVLANRLSADADARVCLLEAGPSDQGFPIKQLVNIPVGIMNLMGNPKYNWLYQYSGEEHLGGREIFCPRGRMLGGSSALNGMAYVRGHRNDFALWEELGAKGWGYDEVLPYFKKSEHWERGLSEFHGETGELNVADFQSPHVINEVFLAAAQELQYRRNDDFNGAEQEGFGYFQLTQKHGERMSTARAFLHPVMRRPNLTVITDALTERVLLEGSRATGVAVRHKGQLLTITARREVIVSGGAINSPQILLLSGIGPAAELLRHGIAVRHELPGVGENLQDHQDIPVVHASPDTTLYGLSSKSLGWMAKTPFQYLFNREGPWTTGTCETAGFVRSLPSLEQPDLEIIFFPMMVNQPQHKIPRGHGFSVHISLLQPKSRGRITLNSPNPIDKPRLSPNFLSHPDDMAGLIRGVKVTRQLLGAPAFAAYRGPELAPGPAVQTDDEIADHLRLNVGTTFHPAGSCKMGIDSLAVVDSELRVHGIEGLRVIDASIMPQVTSGNTNAPTIMIAEKGADMIRRHWTH